MSTFEKIEKEIERIAAFSNGTVGVSALHLESGDSLAFNAIDPFPMASTYKVPIAVQLLKRIDAEEIKLDAMIDIGQSDLSPGGGIISAHFYQPGVALSVLNLLETMLTISDNTASDKSLELAGGQETVSELLKKLGLEAIRIDRDTKFLIADLLGISDLSPQDEWSLPRFKEHEKATTPESKKASAAIFLADRRDTSTPQAMVSLLERIYRKELLKEESTKLLLDIMRRCQSGKARLKGMLPFATVVAHKTGTLPLVAINDVGIITLPDDAGHVAIAVFVKSVEKTGAFIEDEESEVIIAQIARAVYDFFLYRQ
jgi:beta-lactamase class A